MIAKEQLIHGAYYFGRCRNAQVARWNADKQVFVHWRTKFGNRFLEEIKCPEDEARYDVFVTEGFLDIQDVEEEIPIAP